MLRARRAALSAAAAARIVEAPAIGYAGSVKTSGLAAGSALGVCTALLCLSCGGASSGSSSMAAATAPVTTVELPPPADAAPSAAPGPSSAPSADPSPSGESKAVGPERPLFVARFAVVFRSNSTPSLSGPFGGDSIMLFQQSPVTCDVAAVAQTAPSHIRTSVTWKAGLGESTFQQFVFKDGKGMLHAGSIEVLSAPANKGDVGRVRLNKVKDANVLGGEIDALVCE